MLLVAPGLFSTITGLPASSDSFRLKKRARMSAPLPGGNPTSAWICRSG